MPTPKDGQSQDDFISSCMSSESMMKEFPEQKQRQAVCFSQWKKGKKEQRFAFKGILELKEDLDELIVSGYIATTHFDGQDIILKEALDKWASEINEGNPKVNKVSVNHDRIPHVAGVGIKGTARVDSFPDGNYGLFVATKIDKTRDDFAEIKYRIDNDFLDSYSIEYIAPEEELRFDSSTNARILDSRTELFGWTLASQPMNEHAVMIKELVGREKKEEKKENKKPIGNTEEVKMTDNTAPPVGVTMTLQEKEEYDSLRKQALEAKTREVKEQEYKKIIEETVTKVKEDLKSFKVENKAMLNRNIETKEFVEYKEAIKAGSKVDVDAQFKIAGKTVDALGLLNGGVAPVTRVDVCSKEYKFGTNGTKLEFKGLGITTNQNTDTDYLLSAAELSDVFDPVIYNYLNEKTTTWSVLQKDDYSNKGNNQVQFTVKTTANASAGAYTGNAITTGNVTRKKYMTKFKKYQAGVEIDGDMIAAARGGPIGDVFAQEVKDSTDDLLATMNLALYAEVGAETAAGVIGFEYITDSAGNTTLYSITRSGDSYLYTSTATDTYINQASANISSANLRKAIRQAIEKGASLKNLVFFTSPIQYDKIKAIYEDMQRMPPTSMRFGFEGLMAFDGVPVFYDKDCNDDDVFLVDLETHRIAVWVPPTLEMLGKDADSQKGFIKSYWCTYNRCPNRMVQIYGCATT